MTNFDAYLVLYLKKHLEVYMELLIGVLFGVLIGGSLGFVLSRLLLNGKISSFLAQQGIHKNQIENLEQRIAENNTRYQEVQNRLKSFYENQMETAKKDWANESSRALGEQQKHFNEITEKLTAELKLATEEMLKKRQKEFSESSQTNLNQIVNPLKDTIEKMKQTMRDSTLKQVEMSSVLKTELEQAKSLSEAAKHSVEELSKVFRCKGKVQGDWGETILMELLESQGLKESIHFDMQNSLRDVNGKVIQSESNNSYRPDLILHLDSTRDVIIDSKVSLSAFMDYVNAETEEQKKLALKSHVVSIKKHVKELSKKDYLKHVSSSKVVMDYIIMFVPHSGALWTALNADTNLWREAMEQNVFIADEQSLYAALRIVNLTWRQIEQAKNHEKVYALANEMIERVALFTKHYSTIGDHLKKVIEAYNNGERKLVPEGQSIIQTCRKLEKLGAKVNSKKPLNHIERIPDLS